MIVGSSAVVAVLREEEDTDLYGTALSDAAVTDPLSGRMSAATLVGVCVVIDSVRDPIVTRRLNDLLANNRVTVEPFTAEHARIVREAHRDFGRRSGHPAKLNMGDCFSYTLAKGDDFAHTDARSALTP